MRILTTLILALCSLTMACHSSSIYSAQPIAGHQVPDVNIDICRINAGASQMSGKRVAIRALYKSDASYYEFFDDGSCLGNGHLSVSKTVGTGDDSVKSFYANWRARCRDRGLNYCAESAEVRADIEIVIEADGLVTANILTVWSVNFTGPK